MTARTDLEELTVEAIRKKLNAVSLELRNSRLELTDSQEDLEFAQSELETMQTSLSETQLELQNIKDALANSEQARRIALSSLAETQLDLQNARDALANSEHSRREANQNRVISRPRKEQEVFAVLKFQKPQDLPTGGFRIFAQQRKVIDHTLDQFIADNPKLAAIEVKELRFDPSPRGENVIQHMRRDKDAPIKLKNRSFVLKDPKEEMMIEYITAVYKTHTLENSAASNVQ
ncbi:hypothetical protein BGZ76_002902 [Entomortierella beljakovae]|nr:hypothetical protein BGZ76_002902 [Entomortierella beljakovae]